LTAFRTLLLAAAAGLLSVASAQAANLPVKAKPVEYVKVCNAYGAGFFYVPGTDTCLKIGAYIRSDHIYGAGSPSALYLGTVNSLGTRDAANFYTFRARINLTTDWRTQTDYGVLRAYAAMIAQQSTGDASSTGTAGILRAFIQFAGFTLGHAVSYYDFLNAADYTYVYSVFGATTGVLGTDLIAYTWRLGNGWSVSIDAEDSGPSGAGRRKNVVNASNAGVAGSTTQLFGFAFGATGPTGNGSTQAAWTPDIAGNIRVDQEWGSAQLSGALHNMNASYYSNLPGVLGNTTTTSTQWGHPGNTWGWAIQGGVRFRNVFQPKNRFEASGYYCNGATAYCVSTPISFVFGSGNEVAGGFATDGVFINGSSIEKTEAWGVQTAYEHFWNAQWRTSVIGGYTEINYSDTARSWICGLAPGSVSQYNFTFVGGAAAGCQPSFSQYAASTRTAWNPHPMLEIGLDLIWYHINSSHSGILNLGAAGSRPAGPYRVVDQDRFVSWLRVQKTILP
jgi:hypothetical protein